MPSFASIITLASMASVSLAISVTSPTKFQLWDSGKTNTIKWSSVNTDPQTVDIYLAHMAAHPPLYSLLFSNYQTSKGSADVSGLQLPSGDAYQINLVSTDNNGILAQSQQFNVTGEAVAATSTLEGYTGPTYTPTASGSKATDATKSATKTASLTTVVSTGTDSTGATVTRTSTSTATNDAQSTATEETGTRSAVSAASGTATSTSTVRPNAAAGNMVATSGLVAMFLGAAALLV